MAITKGKIATYTLLPGILPRIFAFFTSGFSYLSYYMALVYGMVRLLPDDHPYLVPQNVGRYGVRHVISEAADNLVFKRQNIDQILIFFLILVGFGLMLVQFILLAVAFMTYQPVFAFGSVDALFSNPNAAMNSRGPEQDIIFIIMDKVFGVQGLYNSCVSVAGVACENAQGVPITHTESAIYPFPFHHALHSMFAFYSMGILAVGALVLVYFVIAVVGETAATGTPFGQRFNKAWVPVRIIVFFALLIPLNQGGGNTGLNGAQLITLWVAKYGSNFATNAWTGFNTTLTETHFGAQENLIAMPNIPETGNLNQFMLTARTCAIAETAKYGHTVKAYIVRPSPPLYITDPPPGLTTSNNAKDFMGTDFEDAVDFMLDGDITVRIGVLGTDTDGDGAVDEYSEHTGHVFPYCGEMTISVEGQNEPGVAFMTEKYYKILQETWTNPENTSVAQCLVNRYVSSQSSDPNCPDLPTGSFIQSQTELLHSKVTRAIVEGIALQKSEGEFGIPEELLEKGWGGAAIWFNRVAEMNGAVTGAVFNLPRPKQYPYALEQMFEKRKLDNLSVAGRDRFSADFPGGISPRLRGGREAIHAPMYQAYRVWNIDNRLASPQNKPTNNIVIDFFNAVLGTSGIFDMRRNVDTHPLAQLTAIGKGMMEATVFNAALAVGGSLGDGLVGWLDPTLRAAAKTASSFLFSMVTASIGIAVILYYVLPLLPFIYFLFAVSGWVKSIFEAVVAMPLWALSHLQIGGDGLPGQGAASGYFLLLEIFIRPILILFGLIASISVFAAMVSVLNVVFDLVVSNVGGFDTALEESLDGGADTTASLLTNPPTALDFYRGPVDEFFFTALYAIIAYLTGLACFKMVDLIPNSILRWMGQSVSTFQENAGDPASALTQQVYKGTLLLSNQVKGSAQGDLAILADLG